MLNTRYLPSDYGYVAEMEPRLGLASIPSVAAKPAVKVVLVEHKIVARESWAKLINQLPGFVCTAVCASGEAALRVIPSLAPDIILMDIFLPRMSGIECIKQLKSLVPKAQFLIFTNAEDYELVFMALRAGADGYLLKSSRPIELHAAMLEALRGGAPMSSEISRHVIESFRKPVRSLKPSVSLSAREEEILILLSKGYLNKEIADKLSLSVETIKCCLKKINDKLHARSRVEAVARYMAFNPCIV